MVLPGAFLLGGSGSLFGRFSSLFAHLGNWPIGRTKIKGLAAQVRPRKLRKPAISQYLPVEQGVDATGRAALSGANIGVAPEELETWRRNLSAECWFPF